MIQRTVKIGSASATFVDSRIAMPQLLGCGEPLDYLVFDCLAEGVMSILARAKAAGEPSYVADFVHAQITPFLRELASRRIKIIANAGGLDPHGCAQALRNAIQETGLDLRVASIAGDDLSNRINELIVPGTPDIFSGEDLRARLDQGDQALSLTAYTGGFAIAAALEAGADIVVAGRCVDSATTLGALIHEFGWLPDDFDKLAAGTLVGHLIECTTQVTGGTFTDWMDVPDWANIGFPIVSCEADGSAVIGKPAGTGGLVSRGTVAEQLLYEVSDPSRYIVPDVICDFSEVTVEEIGENRVCVRGAKGRGRPEHLKATLTWDQGWRVTAMAPIIGLDSAAKADRVAAALFDRVAQLARQKQLPAFSLLYHDVIGGEGSGLGQAICRMVVDHPTLQGAQLFAREQSSIMTNMAQGLSVPLGTQIRPITQIGSFALNPSEVTLTVDLDGEIIAFSPATAGVEDLGADDPVEFNSVAQDNLVPVPLIQLAWVRSGDKGNLFNVGVIARDPVDLPWIWNALTPKVVAQHYAEILGLDPSQTTASRYPVPGIAALNLVINQSLGGGMLANPTLDPAAKGMGQLLLEYCISVPRERAASIAAQHKQEK